MTAGWGVSLLKTRVVGLDIYPLTTSPHHARVCEEEKWDTSDLRLRQLENESFSTLTQVLYIRYCARDLAGWHFRRKANFKYAHP